MTKTRNNSDGPFDQKKNVAETVVLRMKSENIQSPNSSLSRQNKAPWHPTPNTSPTYTTPTPTPTPTPTTTTTTTTTTNTTTKKKKKEKKHHVANFLPWAAGDL